MPIPNPLGVAPVRTLSAPDQGIDLQLGGAGDAFAAVSLSVVPDSVATPVPGTSQQAGRTLSFAPVGGGYQQGESYSVSLFNPPLDTIDGVSLVYDQVIRLQAAPLFGAAGLALQRVEPGVIVAGVPANLTLHGAQLDQATQVHLGPTSYAPGQWSVDSTRSQLSFTATVGSAGYYTVRVDEAAATVSLPVALRVSDPLSITSVSSDSLSGAAGLGNRGGDRVTVSGSGLDAGLSAHIVPASPGHRPQPSNRVPHVLSGGAAVLTAPACLAGQSYEVHVVKEVTGESAVAPSLLLCADETPPSLVFHQALDAAHALILRYDEPVTAAGFSVSMALEDYSGAPDQDVSGRFELLQTGSDLILRRLPTAPLENNRAFTVTLTGIQDAAGVAPLTGSSHIEVAKTRDTLPPQGLQLRRHGDAAPITAGLTLTRGRSYEVEGLSTDNRSVADKILQSLRISTDGGLSYGPRAYVAQPPYDSSGLKRPLPITVPASAPTLHLEFEVIDEAGNRATLVVQPALQDPQVLISDVVTTPAPVEERSSVTLAFVVSGGEADLVTDASLHIFGHRLYPDQVIDLGGSHEFRFGARMPSLSELMSRIGSDQVALSFAATHNGLVTTKADSFRLVGDATPPQVAILSPADQAGVGIGQPTEVAIRTFDRNGIAQVTAALDAGAPQVLSDPSRFVFTPVAGPNVRVDVVATDVAGLSSSTTVTLRPVPALAAAPRLAIHGPAAGTTVRERQVLRVDVELTNLTSAELYLDLGGSETNPANPPPVAVTRSAADPDRFPVEVTLPSTAADTALVLRLQESGTATPQVARRFLNLLDDEAVTESAALSLTPAATVLGGTQLWVDAAAPAMADFSPASQVVVEDPQGSGSPVAIPLNSGARAFAIDNAGASVRVEAQLQDLSGNQNSQSQTLSKLPYLAQGDSLLFAAPAGWELGPLVAAPGLSGGGQTAYFAVNRLDDGYELRDEAGVFHSSTTGAITAMHFTGAGLAVQESLGGDRRLHYWPIVGGALGVAETLPLHGELVGGSGHTLFTRHGALIDGYRYTPDGLVPLAGAVVPEPVRSAVVYADQVLVLTGFGSIFTYGTVDSDFPRIAQLAMGTAQVGERLVVEADRLWVVGTDQLHRYQRVAGTPAGQLLHLGSLPLDGRVQALARDGELLWLRTDGPYERGTWHAYRGSELVALDGNAGLARVFGASRMLFATRAGELRARATLASSAAGAFSPSLTETPFGVLIAGAVEAATLGGQQITVQDPAGNALPIQPLWVADQLQYFLERRDLPPGALTVQRADRSGALDSALLTRNETADTTVLGFAPDGAASLAQGVTLPLAVTLPGSSRVASARANLGAPPPRHWRLVQAPSARCGRPRRRAGPVPPFRSTSKAPRRRATRCR